MSYESWESPGAQPDTSSKGFSLKNWMDSEAIKSGPWTPPSGFKDSIAGEVSTLQHVNYGSLKYDPATVATQAMFKRETGINVESLQLGNATAVTKAKAALSAQEPKPALIIQNNWSLSTFIANGFAEAVDPLMPKQEMWKPLQPYGKEVFTTNIGPRYSGSHLYAGPQILEGLVAHIRPDLLEQQGLDPKVYTQGEWTWDDLEKAMKAFEGTGKYAWAFYGGSGDPEYVGWNFQSMVYQQGETIVQDDGTVNFYTKSAQRALKRWVKWVNKGWVPSGTPGFTQGDLSTQFMNGSVAMVPVFTDLIPTALEQYEKGTEYTINIPKKATVGPNPGPAGIASTASLIINPFAPPAKKLAALTYMDARCSYESAWYEYTNEGNQSWVQAVYKNTPDMPFSKQIGKAISLCNAETWKAQQQIYTKFATEANKALIGDKSPEKALRATQKYIDTLLGQSVVK